MWTPRLDPFEQFQDAPPIAYFDSQPARQRDATCVNQLRHHLRRDTQESDWTLWGMRHDGEMPQPIRIGRAVRWGLEVLKKWVDAGVRNRMGRAEPIARMSEITAVAGTAGNGEFARSSRRCWAIMPPETVGRNAVPTLPRQPGKVLLVCSTLNSPNVTPNARITCTCPCRIVLSEQKKKR